MNAPLAGRLDQVGERAASELRRRDRQRCLRAAWLRALPLLFVVPLVVFALGWILAPSFAEPSTAAGFGRLALVTFAIAAALALSRAVRRFDRSLGARDGLARLDRELGSEGRLQAAREFLDVGEPSSFMQAAIADAEPHVVRARSHRLMSDRTPPLERRAWLAPLGALALCALLAWFAPRATPSSGTPDTELAQARSPSVSQARRERPDAPKRDLTPAAPAPEPRANEHQPGAPTKSEERGVSREPEREAKESAGKTGEGLSAQATPTSSSSLSRGFLSTQSQPSTSKEAEKPSTKKAKLRKQKDEDPGARKKLDEQSGATAGTGVGSGSSKNPGSTDWESKDQISSDEEEPLGDDEEVDDESDESEARGGLQPSLRDRRPAVNRDLTIGFGNEFNPDANGRGGASERKKSRGVASLVLGVPIPDHVKGQPNPGRTKITQERVEPRADDALPIDAAARAPRSAPIGRTTSPALAPWMRELVRSYFLKIRKRGESQT